MKLAPSILPTLLCLFLSLSFPLFAQTTRESFQESLEPLPPNDSKNIANTSRTSDLSDSLEFINADITAEQYCFFLNAVETTATHGFYHPEMGATAIDPSILQTITEDGIHLSYSIIGEGKTLPLLFITHRDAICFSNWIYHHSPIGDAVTDDVLYTPLDPDIENSVIAPQSASLPHKTAEISSTQQHLQHDTKTSHASYLPCFYKHLGAVASTAEWAFWNIGGEIIEAIIFQQCGLYAIVPYTLYMGSVILCEYENQEYWAAAGTILHAIFDIACMLGSRIGFDVAGILCSALESCGLKCVATFFETIHNQIDSFLHLLGVEHSHAFPIESSAETASLRHDIAADLERLANHPSPTPNKRCREVNCKVHQSLFLNDQYWKQFESQN